MQQCEIDESPLSKVSFIPEKIVLGKYSYPSEDDCSSSITSAVAAFPSCRLPTGKWSQLSIFERLCGFKPNVQRDSEKELMKAIKNAVDEFDNTPQKGFKLIAWNENIYRFSGNAFAHTHHIVLEDPRGFCIGIPIQEFFEILMSSGGNLKDGVLDVECVYAWDEWSIFHLFPTSRTKYEKILADSRKVMQREKDPTAYVHKSELQVGHVYQTSDKWKFTSGEYMYLGIHDTFSPRAHKDAFKNGRYDVEKICKEESGCYATDVSTSIGRMVFYRVGANTCKANNRHDDRENVFVSRGNISKCFVKEVPLRSAKMYNDSSKPVTLENVQAAMKTCLLFNKLDLTDRDTTQSMSFDLFNVIFGNHKQSSMVKPANLDYKLRAYPFDAPYTSPIISATYNRYIKVYRYTVNGYASNPSSQLTWEIVDAMSHDYYYNRITLDKFTETIHGAYAKIQPRVYDLKLENGTSVPPEIAVQLRSWS